MRENFEAINHKQAIDYIFEIAKQQILSEKHIKDIHHLVLKNIDNDNAGRYRSSNVIITGADHITPKHFLLNDKMAHFIDWYQNSNDMHPIAKACQLHSDFVIIHLFIDGNGRTSRLLLNLELIKAGYPPCIITIDRRLQYYEALNIWAMQHNKQPFYELINECLMESFKVYQKILRF